MNHLLKKSLAALLAVLMLLSVANAAAFTTTAAHDGDHTFNAEADIPALAPTCTAAGHGKGWTCNKEGCDYVAWEAGKQTIAPLGHDYVDHAAKAPTCTEIGWDAYQTCSRCDYTTYQAKAALGHDWGEWVVTKTATTCGEQSEKQHTCARCGKIELQKYDTVAHTPKDVAAVAATCTTAGSEAGKVCSVCGAVISGCGPVAALGHKWKKGETVKPTCETAGKTPYTCERCGDTYDDNVQEALGHDYVDDAEVPATGQKEGKTAGRHCARCNKVFIEQKVIPKADHDWEIVPAVAPTCTEPGRSEGAKCKVCGEVRSVSEELPAKGHNFVSEVITPVTCEANGLIKKYCTECNESETLVVPATGHDWGDWIYEENFTCEVGGERYKICANCGEIGHRETLPPQGHDWSGEWTVDTEPTCTVKGYKSHHCTRCDARNDITTMPKLPHNYLNKGTKATTKHDGLITGVCAVCGLERKPLTVKRVKSFTLSKTSYIYDGKAKKPAVVVKDAAGKKLQKDTDYKVTYASGRKKVGAYVVKITLIGNYSGTKKLKFTIKLGTPKGLEAKTSAAKQAIKVSCAALKGAKKYVFYYSTEKDGGYKKIAVSKKPAALIKTLEPGTYFFKVRALTTDKNGDRAYSAASAPLRVRLAK